MTENNQTNDPRVEQLAGLDLKFKSLTLEGQQEGEYEGEWSARAMKKKFRKRKITVKFDNKLSFVPEGVEFFDVEYVGTTSLTLINITNKKFVCTISSNEIGSTAKVNFKWRTISPKIEE